MGEFYRSFSKAAFVKHCRAFTEITENDLIAACMSPTQAIEKNGQLVDDFLIHDSNNVINVLNAPSPAATSSLSIGDIISEKVIRKL
jgi:L-2-hydroxyglutarate oxidase